jgi:hypothetical protein
VLSHVANHISETAKTVTQRVYIKFDYDDAKRQAWERWGEELDHIIRYGKPATKIVKLLQRSA